MSDKTHEYIVSIIRFIGLLRKAGLKLGPDITLKTTQAIAHVPPSSHRDLYWTLYACIITDHDQQEIFTQVFALYWGHAKLPDSALAVSLPRSKIKSKGEKSFSKRTLDAFKSNNQNPHKTQTEIEKLNLSWSDHEQLEHMDFDSMSTEEFLKAQKLVTKLKFIFNPVSTRRFKTAQRKNKIDFKNTLKQYSKSGGQLIELKYKKPKTYYPPVLMLIDISGSMSRYAQILLRFAYLLNQSRRNVHVFVFATKLSCISMDLRKGDIDESLELIGNKVEDFNSGTRIGDCIKDFNYNYLKKIINSKTEILFVTDGLDRGDALQLDKHISRLKRACKRFIWLNPLLRFQQYQPKAQGARTLYPHVDQMLPVHNLDSLAQLIEVLQGNSTRNQKRVYSHG